MEARVPARSPSPPHPSKHPSSTPPSPLTRRTPPPPPPSLSRFLHLSIFPSHSQHVCSYKLDILSYRASSMIPITDRPPTHTLLPPSTHSQQHDPNCTDPVVSRLLLRSTAFLTCLSRGCHFQDSGKLKTATTSPFSTPFQHDSDAVVMGIVGSECSYRVRYTFEILVQKTYTRWICRASIPVPLPC